LLQSKEEKEIFNAVIEGAYHDLWTDLNYKIAQLEVPEEVSVLNDSTYRYLLYGKTDDFENIKTDSNADGLERKIDFLGFCEGVVLPYMGGIPNLLERPRAVCLRDGRIFVDEHMLTNSAYLKAIPSIVKAAGELFKGMRNK